MLDGVYSGGAVSAVPGGRLVRGGFRRRGSRKDAWSNGWASPAISGGDAEPGGSVLTGALGEQDGLEQRLKLQTPGSECLTGEATAAVVFDQSRTSITDTGVSCVPHIDPCSIPATNCQIFNGPPVIVDESQQRQKGQNTCN